MKLNAGSIIINKPLERVYSFLTRLENLEKQIAKGTISDYEIEVEDELSGEFEVGTIVAIYLFSVYEGVEDRCFEFKVVNIEKNNKIKLELVYIGIYNHEKDSWSDSIPIETYFGVIGFEMKFSPKNGKTRVLMTNTFKPKSKVFEIVIRLFNFIGRFSSKKYYKEWAKLVEQHA